MKVKPLSLDLTSQKSLGFHETCVINDDSVEDTTHSKGGQWR